MKRNGTLCILLIVNLLPSCDSGTSSHKLVIELPQPKEAAQAALQDIWIRSLIPQTSEATCADLNKNFYAPDDTRYRQESLDVMNAPFAGKISNLKPSWNDTQSRLIYVECFDANGGLILNGCSEVDNSKKEIELSLSIVCASNKADCDNDFSTGCETAITTVSNCGACRQGCTNDHGQTACPQGSCAPTCAEGFSDCDGNPDNGCETDLNSEAGCNGNGTCSFVNNASVCSCRLPYAGNHCEQCAADYHGIYPNCFQPSGDSCLVSECFLVAPTGQTACYNYGDITDCGSLGSPPNCINAYCGQDAQYAKSRTFTFTNDEVTDSATGLIWQRTASTSNGPWSQALNTCSGLWRLPNPIELHSIVDHGSYGYPMIDSEAFPSTPCSSPYDNDCLYWTSANDNNDPDNNAWAVRFNEDYYLHPLVTAIYKSRPVYVRCVRGGPAPDSPGDGGVLRFVSYAGITEDLVTKLIWTSDQVSGCSDQGNPCVNWREALKRCEALVQGGVTDWRLPNLNELLSILDYGKMAAPATYMPGVTTDYYWSSTNSSDSFSAWIVYFQNGEVNFDDKTFTHHFLCVH